MQSTSGLGARLGVNPQPLPRPDLRSKPPAKPRIRPLRSHRWWVT